ncbi:rCG57080 [Rattus norvegicus]|uniref:RCG57080 n=1 Tax=Rattus norvegicus TaxID=10116 RepID=A6JDC3_RAT|nr:rCG57080 [Rattus norvegicus]
MTSDHLDGILHGDEQVCLVCLKLWEDPLSFSGQGLFVCLKSRVAGMGLGHPLLLLGSL